MKDATKSPNGSGSYALPTTPPQTAPCPTLPNRVTQQSGPPKSNLVDTAPRAPKESPVNKPDNTFHNK